MSKSSFVHLHVHTEFSLLDGLGKPSNLFARAKELGHTSVAITDHGNMDSYVRAIRASEATGIKYIPGCEFYVVDSHEAQVNWKKKDEKLPRLHLTMWAKDAEGVLAMFRLLNTANKKLVRGRPLIEWIDLYDDALYEHVMAGTACTSGILMRDYKSDLDRVVGAIKEVFIEVMPHNTKEQLLINKNALKASEHFGIPIIATNDCHYINEKDAYYQEILLAVQRRDYWDNPKRWRFDVTGLHFRTEEEMVKAFSVLKCFTEKQVREFLENTLIVAEGSNCEFKPVTVEIPNVVKDSAQDAAESLIEHTMIGFDKVCRKHPYILEKKAEYYDRIEEELELIIKLKFEEYFLLVEDLIGWCKANELMTGPGRGSVGGSLVAYCLGITNCDPIKYELLFARFISPARIDLPDIDMDFEDKRRHEVKKYLKGKYGEDNVTGVSTFSEMHGRGALRDIAKVFNVPEKDVDAAAKAIVVRSGGDVRANFSLADAFDTFEEGKKFKKKYPKVSEAAMALEGTKKSAGQHAAGIVISTNPFSSGIHGYISSRKKGEEGVINWDKNDSEYMGLMKLDVLGLNTLAVLNEAKKLIRGRTGIDLDFEAITFDDPKVFKEFSKGNTVGIFQFGCLTGDTCLYRASANQYALRKVTIKELFEYQKSANFKFRKLAVHSMYFDSMVRINTINKIVYTGIKPVYRYTTVSGKSIKATLDHKFLTSRGWKKLGDIKLGDNLICTDFKKIRKEYPYTGYGVKDPLARFRFKNGLITFEDKVNMIGYCGEEDTYDVEMTGEPRNFIANGIVTHNSYGVKKLCTQIGVKSFNDLVDINALYRPGVLRSGLATEFVKRKHGEKRVTYIHKFVENITKDTYGIILYQEQIMRLLYDLGGLTWKTADMIRKVVSKSKGEEQFMKFKQMFIDGCVEKRTVNAKDAEKVFDELKYFGSYGFNKAHAVEYSMIGYWGMHLRVYYPDEFFESLLTWGAADEDYQGFIDEIKRFGFTIEPADINKSHASNWIIKDGVVRPPICILKGIGERAAEEITLFKEKYGDGITQKDLLESKEINRRVVHKGIIDKIRNSGALSSIGIYPDNGVDLKLYPYTWETNKTAEVLSILFKDSFDTIPVESKRDGKRWYFAKVTEVKFGYKQKVGQQKKGGQSAGQSLGGVYGYVRDTDGGYMMATFGGDIYQKKKDEIEHCAGKLALFYGSPIRKADNIIIYDVHFEDEFMEWPEVKEYLAQ